MKNEWNVIIAGGGPADFFAVIRRAEVNLKLGVLFIEKGSQILGKMLISGGGEMNQPYRVLKCWERLSLVTS